METYKDFLKRTYKRKNNTENEVLFYLIDKILHIKIHPKNNTETIIKKRLGFYPNRFNLFLDAQTNILTENGNYKKVEFLLTTPQFNWIWIDAKSLNKKSPILTDAMYRNFEEMNTCKGKFYYYCVGKGYNDYILNNYINHIVKNNLRNIRLTKSLDDVIF